LTVYYDPILLDIDLEQRLMDLGAQVNGNDHVLGRVIEVPVFYDPEKAPDLLHISEQLRLTVHELAELHSREIYHVFMLGFMPGFPYMGVLNEALVLPRKATPAKKVAAGTVAIAGKQTGIYPFDSPGGWHAIGWTPLKMFENGRSLLEPGDQVKFIPQWG
jgi:inhibitor of KinA